MKIRAEEFQTQVLLQHIQKIEDIRFQDNECRLYRQNFNTMAAKLQEGFATQNYTMERQTNRQIDRQKGQYSSISPFCGGMINGSVLPPKQGTFAQSLTHYQTTKF